MQTYFSNTSDESKNSTSRAMYVSWLVCDLQSFKVNPAPTSELDRILDDSLTYEEWFALFFEELGVDQSGYLKWVQEHPTEVPSVLAEFDDEIPDYPLLSRIRGYSCDVVFEVHELEQLERECSRVRSHTSNDLAKRAVDKLARICGEAQRSGLNIYFLSN